METALSLLYSYEVRTIETAWYVLMNRLNVWRTYVQAIQERRLLHGSDIIVVINNPAYEITDQDATPTAARYLEDQYSKSVSQSRSIVMRDDNPQGILKSCQVAQIPCENTGPRAYRWFAEELLLPSTGGTSQTPCRFLPSVHVESFNGRLEALSDGFQFKVASQ